MNSFYQIRLYKKADSFFVVRILQLYFSKKYFQELFLFFLISENSFQKSFNPDSRKKNCSSLQIYEKTQNQRQQTKTKSDKTRLKPSFYRFCTTDMSNICFIYRFSLLLFTIQESAFYFVCSVVIWYVFDCRDVFCYVEVCLFSSCN